MNTVTRKKRISPSTLMLYIVLTGMSLFTLAPFLLVLIGSLTPEIEIVRNGVSFFPKDITFSAYTFIFEQNKDILRSYGVTIFVTIVGTALSVALTSMLAYVISLKSVKYRNHIAFFVYFTMLFQGGMIPWYILNVSYLGLKDSLLALILPMCINPFFAFLMKSYLQNIPESLRESGIIDGAGEFRIFLKIVMPISIPIIATITLFYMLMYWNDFYLSLFFIESEHLVSLQYHLYRILSTLNYLASSSTTGEGASSSATIILPNESVRLATTILTIGPIVFVYPFIQKHFVKGITIGAVKG
ncbi:carbohydrate ABC transporter permease [Paenibacillus sp. J5C_2022]|uniref:carbohydrate ABC transporter permease n=1 Tax=Paenibacillus sp. J5C2022 TaxID=2977129 RepID=UPI0021D1E6DA|nr:carbohydrate ABC transporter permease [Paenibacillus sp. J5C2022]MCU6712831.1 carbohydrate ABC transporter permease [Paenibacillus sp. J5C2022]